MERKYFRKKLKKSLSKLINCIFVSTVIFVVLFSTFSYQLAFTSHRTFADESTSDTTATASDSGSSSDTEAKPKEEPKEVPKGEPKVEPAVQETVKDETPVKVDDTPVAAPETPEAPATVSEIPAEEPASQDLAQNLLPQTSQNISASPDEFWKTCDLTDEEKQQIEDVKYDECRQKTECEKIKICYAETLASINIAESVVSDTQSNSITGGNEIVGGGEGCTDCGAKNTSENNQSSSSEPDNNPENGNNKPVAAVISTGDALAQTGSVNEVNTNIYTDNGVKSVENISGDYTGDVNLLETFDSILESAKDLHSQNADAFEKINIANINVAENVENTATALADSGENKILNTGGSASITTGNADAIASAVNIINTNIVGNNWLFAIVNVFGNWTGDLIVPGEGLLQTPAGKMIFDKIASINYAENIHNFVYSDANTGNNSESGISGNAAIETGNAVSAASSTNLVNTNIVQNNWFFLLINNAGNWMGKVINWDKDTGEQNTVYEYNFGSLDNENDNNPGKIVSVYNNNYSGNVSNFVLANADSGNNAIESAGSASIKTGNAGAFASAFNFVNTNIVGNNWFFGIVNNAGNWTGNVIFGYPDLEVSLSSDKSEVKPGESFDYTITYKNIGKAKCDDTQLMFSLPKYLAYLSDSNGSPQNDNGNYYWSLSGLKPGEERSFNISVNLDENVPKEITALESSTGIRTETTEKELSNNYESESIKIAFPAIISVGEGVYSNKESSIKVSRSEDSQIAMGLVANHFVMVKNYGKNTLYNVLVTEKIKDPSGKTAAVYNWAIAKLKKGQKATIQYQIFLNPPAQLGTYKHSASALGYNEYGYEVKGNKAKAEVTLVGGGGYYSASGEAPASIEEAVQGAEDVPTLIVPAMGIKTDLGGYLKWFWLLALVPAAYYLWKKKSLSWQKMQRFSQQMSNFLSSFL